MRDIEQIFSMRESRSIPFMVDPGETAVVCGVWQTGTIQRYSRCIGSGGQVVFIEANPETIRNLKPLTAGMPWVTWINRAVWSEKAQLEFTRSLGERHSWDRVVNQENAPGQFPADRVSAHDTITVNADTIDAILDRLDIESVDHLNLTVNRSEFEAIEGARGIISRSPKMRIRLPSRSGEITKMKKLLEGLGFTVHVSEHPREWQEVKGKGKRYRVYGVKE